MINHPFETAEADTSGPRDEFHVRVGFQTGIVEIGRTLAAMSDGTA
jgi:hypothetical protein